MVQDKDVARLDHANLSRFMWLVSDVHAYNEERGLPRGTPSGLLTFPGDSAIAYQKKESDPFFFNEQSDQH